MKYVKLGNSGLDVSRICLGCMGFGDPDIWFHKWLINEEESRKIIKHALDNGINFFDTANCYSLGVSEEYLGRAIRDYADRNRVVIATKVYQKMHDGPNGSGLSRKHIIAELDASLKRLQMDYVDLYIIHRFDYNTPIEETMRTLHELVVSGKVRYIGASAMYAWQFQKAQYIAEKNGWTKFISMQNHYNLIYREEEREMIPFCKDSNVSCTPYSPLASGRLSRPFHTESKTKRQELDKTAMGKYGATLEQDKEIIVRVSELANKKNCTMTQITLAWLLHKNTIAAPIIGATNTSHIDEAIKALDIELSQEEINYLEEKYLPHKVVGAL